MSLRNDSPESKEASNDAKGTAPAVVNHDLAVNRPEEPEAPSEAIPASGDLSVGNFFGRRS
jgi:hypothetical protein